MRAVQTQDERWQEQTRGVFWETDGLIAFTTDLVRRPLSGSLRKIEYAGADPQTFHPQAEGHKPLQTSSPGLS